MQRTFYIECRVDYADNDKNEVMREAIARAAVHINATAVLLADGIKPQVVAHSDDWFTPHEEIKWMEDTIQKGIDDTNMQDTTEQVSSELLNALRSE